MLPPYSPNLIIRVTGAGFLGPDIVESVQDPKGYGQSFYWDICSSQTGDTALTKGKSGNSFLNKGRRLVNIGRVPDKFPIEILHTNKQFKFVQCLVLIGQCHVLHARKKRGGIQAAH
jgi:hypothetical protein